MRTVRPNPPSIHSRRPAVHERLVRTFKLHVGRAGSVLYDAAPLVAAGALDLSVLRLASGKALLGSHVIHDPTFSRNTMAWSQIADGLRTIGNLVFNADGTVVAGQVHVARVGQPLESFLLFGTTSATLFNTQYSLDGKVWSTGPQIEIGVEFDPTLKEGFVDHDLTSVTPIVNVYGCEASGAYQPVNYAALGLASFSLAEPGSTLQVNFQSSPVGLPPICNSGTFAFNLPSGPLGTSSAVVYSQDGTSFSGLVYDFTGETEYQFEGTMVDSGLAVAERSRPADYRNLWLDRLADDALTVQDLATLPLPDVTSESNGLLFDCMLYVMDPTLRTNLTGQVQPTNLSASTIEVITQPDQTDFLNNYYAPTYFGSGFSSMTQFANQFSPVQVTQLQYAASVILAQQSSFSIVNNSIFAEAATLSSPALQAYVNDPAGNWGQALYAYITQQPIITEVQTEFFAAQNSDTLTRYCSLLLVFDQTGNLSNQYFSAVMGSALFSKCTLYMDPGAAANTDNLQEFLPQTLQQIIDNWLTLPQDPTQGDLAQQELAQQLQDAADSVGGMDNLSQELLNAFQAGGDQPTLSARMSQIYTYLSSKSSLPPAVQKLANFAGALGMIAGITFTIQGLCQWSNLTTSQRIALIGQGLEVTSTVIQLLPQIVTAFTNGVSSGFETVQALYLRWQGGAIEFQNLEPDLSDLTADGLIFNRDLSANAGEIANANFLPSGGKLLFNYGPTIRNILKGVCLMGQVIVAGVAVYSLIKDIVDGAPITQDVMAGLQAFSLSVVAVCDALQLFIESAVVAALGAVFAIVGVVVGIIALFVGKSSPPPTPAQLYITNTILPFVDQEMTSNPVPSGWSLPNVDSSSVPSDEMVQGRLVLGMAPI